MSSAMTPSLPAIEGIDPLPPGRIAMWLVMASDLMFFAGLVGAFIVLRAGNAGLFADHAAGLDRRLGGAGALVLALSSVTMLLSLRSARNGASRASGAMLLATLALAGAFCCLRGLEYDEALNHHTIVSRRTVDASLIVFDGRYSAMRGNLAGYAAPLPSNIDPHVISEQDVARLGYPEKFYPSSADFEDVCYGPGKNVFYAIWFTLTGAHLVHIVVGFIAIGVLLVQQWTGKASMSCAEYVGVFWHFVVGVGIVLFPLIYGR